MTKTEQLINVLLTTYDEIMARNSPEWAVHKKQFPNELVKCTIPFVGERYENQEKRILVYASAENLSGYYLGNEKEWQGDWLDDDSQAINRHRRCFEYEGLKKKIFFPHVHIQPMNDGCLSTAVYYIANKLYTVREKTPLEFYETISFANYGKFSIETELQRNKRLGKTEWGEKTKIDYAGNRELLGASHDFVSADISTLKPDYIIMPASIYDEDKVFVDAVKGTATIIPIYQMNSRVINRWIAHKFEKYNMSNLPEAVRKWYEALGKNGITGKTKVNYLSVFSYLDEVIAKITDGTKIN